MRGMRTKPRYPCRSAATTHWTCGHSGPLITTYAFPIWASFQLQLLPLPSPLLKDQSRRRGCQFHSPSPWTFFRYVSPQRNTYSHRGHQLSLAPSRPPPVSNTNSPNLQSPSRSRAQNVLTSTSSPTAPRSVPRPPPLPLEEAHPRLLHRPIRLRIVPHPPPVPRVAAAQAPRRSLQGNLTGNL